jgi:C1A family cysteine protease
MSKIKKSGLGWKRALPDHRDLIFTPSKLALQTLPASVDLRPQCPPIYDQGRIGSCTANALAGAVEFDRLKASQSPDFVPSRLFIYYNERSLEGDIPLDGGANLRDGVKTLSQQGVCPETEWTYDDTPAPTEGGPFPTGSKPVTQPPQSCYDDAVNYQIETYATLIQDLTQLKGTLAAGFPFAFGFTVYGSWYNQTPPPTIIPMPSGEDTSVGGHAVLCVGYDDSTQLFIIRNSWGTAYPDGSSVGDNGYFYMPYAYLSDQNLCDDFWVINAIEN